MGGVAQTACVVCMVYHLTPVLDVFCMWHVTCGDFCVNGVYMACMWRVCGVYMSCMWRVCGVYMACSVSCGAAWRPF